MSFSELIFLRVFFSDEVFVACCPPPRRDSHPDVLHASVLGLAGCVKIDNLLNEELLSDCWSYCCIICGVGRLSLNRDNNNNDFSIYSALS